MTKEEIMIQMLTQMLETGETLLCPICGIWGKGQAQRFAYFGFTESHLLVALPLNKQTAQTMRIPLKISSLRIKQNKILREYVIDISFATGAPCRITACQKVLLIGSQKETLPRFLQHLESIPIIKREIEDKMRRGEKLRRQYFVGFISHLLFIVTVILSITFSMYVLQEKESIFEWLERIQITHPIWWSSFLVLLALCLLNRFFFGKTVCTLCEDGLFADGQLIRWSEIEKIVYVVKFRRRTYLNGTTATVFIRPFGGEEYAIKILGFPVYGLRKIRTIYPDVIIESNKRELIFVFALAVGVGTLFPFIAHWFV